MKSPAFLITCEHGGNRIPAAYRPLFKDQGEMLASHRGYDRGALSLARILARRLDVPLVSSTVSRLLVDLNRSQGHPDLFSQWSRAAARAERERILETYYFPYRHRVETQVARGLAQGGCVVHVSAHSFTHELDGIVRTADVGFLYDPGRPQEVARCAQWQAALRARLPALRVRRNYPYRGSGDGLTTHLRRLWSARRYVGIELEVNQAIVQAGGPPWNRLRTALADVLAGALVDELPVRHAGKR